MFTPNMEKKIPHFLTEFFAGGEISVWEKSVTLYLMSFDRH